MNAPWKPWPIRNGHDAIAYAQDWRDIIPPDASLPDTKGLTEAKLVARRIGAARMTKLLAYLIPDLSALAGRGVLRIAVDTPVIADYVAHTQDHQLIAETLGLDGISFSHLEDGAPCDAILKLGTRLSAVTSVLAFAAKSGIPLFGLSSTRMDAGLQSLIYASHGYGYPSELSCALGGPIDYQRNLFNTMAFAYFLDPVPCHFSPLALVAFEGQIDEHTQGSNRYHPLAGAIVTLGSHDIAIGSRGICLHLASGRLGYVKPLGDGRYGLKLFHKACPWGRSSISVDAAISWGAGAQGQMIDHCYLNNFGHRDPSAIDGDLVATDAYPVDLIRTGYPRRERREFSLGED